MAIGAKHALGDELCRSEYRRYRLLFSSGGISIGMSASRRFQLTKRGLIIAYTPPDNGFVWGKLVGMCFTLTPLVVQRSRCRPSLWICGASSPPLIAAASIVACVLTVGISGARAQDIEPRAYSNAPIGMNFLIAGYAYTQGGVAFDPALPASNPELNTNSMVLALSRVIDFWGKSGTIVAILPYTWLSGSAELAGDTIEREVSGFGNPTFRMSVNLYGAPALTLKEFKDYQQDLIVGVSLRVNAPWGQYDSSRAVNISTNRWSFKPELGISKALGPLTLEAAVGAKFYTDNTDYFGGRTRSQDPIYSSHGHAIYNFRSGIWASLDVTYFVGGRTAVGGLENADLQQNWRVGGTLAFPVDRHNSVKIFGSSGVSSRTGNDYDLLGVAWQYRWGGGL